MNYKEFQLDWFQEEAIHAIDQEHSVLVTAPTGAGKTVIAEYTVEKCISTECRVIYTAPIKALSNQKYRDFYERYGELVGIVTGDVVLNPYAQVLLMTTEIFRNTIFDDIARLEGVEYVIFDEIHYINDIERGTVWEESIIFAPQHIKFVCLSATIPNINQFAEWMRSVRDVEIDVVEELKRPVPLKHHLYFNGFGIGTVKHLRLIERQIYGDFDADETATKGLPDLIDTDLIRYIQRQKQLPCLYFCFSRKGCEQNALFYANQKSSNFLTRAQQNEIETLFDSLCLKYSIQDDRNVSIMRELVSKGIAYHHAGMLPTLKEVIEQLFTSGLLQLLFTTETFAVGINMPACTAVFESLEKYDGVGFRYLKAREYHQMAGRAGRRGIDEVGYVYARITPGYGTSKEVRRVVSGQIEMIESQFNLAYSSILNLYEKYGEDIYDVCTQSLSNYQNVERIAEINEKLEGQREILKDLPAPTCIHEGVDASKQVRSYGLLQKRIAKQINLLRAERTKIKRQERGRKKKQIRMQKLADVNQRIQQTEAPKQENLCHNCERFSLCDKQARKISREAQRVRHLQLQRAHFENYQKEQIASRLAVLEKLGYIEGETLLPRGQLASQIYGYEMQITQLFFKGFFERLNEDEINVLMLAIVSEPRKHSDFYKKLNDRGFKRMLEAAEAEFKPVRKLESRFGVAELTPTLETQLSAVMLAWSRGCEFEELHQFASVADGDFVRSFRLVVDLLRQMRRAMREHETLLDKLERCIRKINRDVVDAERQLRIGQEANLAQLTEADEQ